MKTLSILSAGLLIHALSVQAKPFSDRELQNYMSHNQNGIIYIWNPLMPLSTLGLDEAKQVAQDMGLSFKEIVDPTIASQVPNADSLASSRLVKLGVMNHYPAIVIHRDGKLITSIIQGYEVPEGLKEYISDYLENGKLEKLAFTGFSNNKNAQSVESAQAKIASSKTVKEIHSANLPSFFFKVSSDGKFISYTIPTDYSRAAAGGNNYLVNTDSQEQIKIPGPWDPVFNQDHETMTLPIRGGGRTVYYGMYDFDELLSRGDSAQPLYTDYDLAGLYQSVGVLNRTGNEIKYRIIAEGAGTHSMRDYSFNRVTKEFKALDSNKSLCPTYRLKLPMIAKDGKEIGGIDMKTGTTGIFSINPDGSCKKVLDLGVKTGKVNFSYDKRYITFHIYSTTATNVTEDFVALPDSYYSSDIFLYDRETKKTLQVTENKTANALYPDFTKDGLLVFAYYPQPSTRGVFFKFLKVNDMVGGSASTSEVSVRNFQDFEKEYAKSSDKAQFFVDFLIGNEDLALTSEQFLKQLPRAQELGLGAAFVKKAAKDGVSLNNSTLVKSLYKSNPDLLMDMLSDNFAGSSEAINILYSSLATSGINDEAHAELNGEVVYNYLKTADSDFKATDFKIIKTYVNDQNLFSDLLSQALNAGFIPEIGDLNLALKANLIEARLAPKLVEVYQSNITTLVNTIIATPVNTQAEKAILELALKNNFYKDNSCSRMKSLFPLVSAETFSAYASRAVLTNDCSAQEVYSISSSFSDFTRRDVILATINSKDPGAVALLNYISTTKVPEPTLQSSLSALLKIQTPTENIERVLNKSYATPQDFANRLLVVAASNRWDILAKYDHFILSPEGQEVYDEAVTQNTHKVIIKRNSSILLVQVNAQNSKYASVLIELIGAGEIDASNFNLNGLIEASLFDEDQFNKIYPYATQSPNFSILTNQLAEKTMNAELNFESQYKLIFATTYSNYALDMRAIFNNILKGSYKRERVIQFLHSVAIKTDRDDLRTLNDSQLREIDRPLYKEIKTYIKKHN